MNVSFQWPAVPEIYFGAGSLSNLPLLISRFGTNALLILGSRSFQGSSHFATLEIALEQHSISFKIFNIAQEPSPQLIDICVSQQSQSTIDVVVAIGGGSVLDAGKAISAMLPLGTSTKSYLEGVGSKQHPGTKVPFIAIPTTSGTGSESTKNAVLSEVGCIKGYKKSLRHANFIPNVAILDPELTVHCPPLITAYSGMDAFTQLLESYLSTASSPFTDALCEKGLRLVHTSLPEAYHHGHNIVARADMALAAMFSGITLANAGLGVVHGIAGALGGYYNIPHGIICSRLMHAANVVTLKKLQSHNNDHPALFKFAEVGKIFTDSINKNKQYYIDTLLDKIAQWTAAFEIPSLNSYGITSKEMYNVAQVSDSKNNPTKLTQEEMIEILELSL